MYKIFLIFLLVTGAFSNQDFYSEAIQHFKEKKYSKCLESLEKSFETNQQNPVYYFYRGKCAFESGQYELAADSFQNAYLLDSKFLTSRLEYARTLFYLKRYSESKIQFEYVLSKNPPEPVKQKIESFVGMIKKLQNRHEINGALVAGIKYDSNLYNRIDSESIYIPAFDFSLSNDNTKLVDRSHYEIVSLNHAYALEVQKSSRIKTALTLYNESWQKHFDRSLAMGFLQSGWEKRGRNWLFYLPLYFQKVGLGGENYLENYGFHPQMEWYFDKFHKVGISFEVSKENYLNPNNMNLDANVIAASINATKVLNPSQLLTLSLDYEKKQKINGDRTDVDLKQYGYGMGYTYLYSPPLKFDLGYEYTQTYYDQTDTLLLSKRKDDRYTWKLGLGYQLNSTMSLTGTVQKLSNHSNHVPFQYDKDIYSLQYVYLIK